MAPANGWPLGLKWFSMWKIWNKSYVNTFCLNLITIVVWDSRFERRQFKNVAYGIRSVKQPSRNPKQLSIVQQKKIYRKFSYPRLAYCVECFWIINIKLSPFLSN